MAKGEPQTDPATWRRVAERLGLSIHDFNIEGAGRGEYIMSGDEGNWRGIIAINGAYSVSEQCRAWVHELAHHCLNVWIPPQLCDAADTYCYEGDISDIRHGIARDVESLVITEVSP